jgi:hypothetical protein
MLGTVSRGGSLTGGSFGSFGVVVGIGGGAEAGDGSGVAVETGAEGGVPASGGAGVGGDGVLWKMVVSASH